jgi:hypothetical protein
MISGRSVYLFNKGTELLFEEQSDVVSNASIDESFMINGEMNYRLCCRHEGYGT